MPFSVAAPLIPLEHLGTTGLLWAVNGGSILELHTGWAILEVPGRESQVTYNRLRSHTRNGRLPWELTSLL